MLKSEQEMENHFDVFKFHKSKFNDKNELKFVEENEFIFQNQLFDIVNKQTINDTIILTCINDIKEKSLISEFTDFINYSHNDFSNDIKKTIFNLLKLIVNEALPIHNFQFRNFYHIINLYDFNIINYSKRILSIDIPPPRFL